VEKQQIDYNLLFRWFVGLGMDDAVWHHAVFSKNRDRLLSSALAQQFFSEVNRQAKRSMSDEHFTLDGTLIQAWASQKSFRANPHHFVMWSVEVDVSLFWHLCYSPNSCQTKQNSYADLFHLKVSARSPCCRAARRRPHGSRRLA
jgi:hypothetical protein